MQNLFVPNAFPRHTRALAVLCSLALTAGLSTARAQDKAPDQMTLVAQFASDEGEVLFFATDNSSHMAGLDIRSQNLGEDYRPNGTTRDLVATFANADEWHKFVALWAKVARSRHKDADLGKYFDGTTLLTLATEKDGDISFSMAGNPDAQNNPDVGLFKMPSKDVGAFGGTVKKITAYFAK